MAPLVHEYWLSLKKSVLVYLGCLYKKKATNKKDNQIEKKINEEEIRGERGAVATVSEEVKWKKQKEIDVQPLHTPLPSNYEVHTTLSITHSSVCMLFMDVCLFVCVCTHPRQVFVGSSYSRKKVE